MKDQADETREGLRSLKLITRNLSNLEFGQIMQKAGLIVEASNGIWIITKPDPL